jgi:hypothetical protein
MHRQYISQNSNLYIDEGVEPGGGLNIDDITQSL